MPKDENNKDPISKTIALTLLFAFVSILGLLAITNIVLIFYFTKGDALDLKRDWFELFKSYSILLSSALTTIIGYYFGQRVGSLKSEQANDKVKAMDQSAVNAIKKVIDDRDQTATEGAVVINDSSAKEVLPTTEGIDDIILPNFDSTKNE